MTQAARLISAIRRARSKGMTYLELEVLGVSSSPWRRLSESGHRYLRTGEHLTRKTGRDGLTRFVIVRGAGV